MAESQTMKTQIKLLFLIDEQFDLYLYYLPRPLCPSTPQLF